MSTANHESHTLADGTTLFTFGSEQLLSRDLWFRQTEQGLESAPPPDGDWRGAEQWWLPGGSRKEGMLAVLPEVMGWLPPGLLAPRKFQVAAGLAYFDQFEEPHSIVDALFVDDAMHVHIVDVRELEEQALHRLFSRWEYSLSERDRALKENLFTSRAAPVLRLRGEYGKLRAASGKTPQEDIAFVLDTCGDVDERKTARAFWHQVEKRCASYWDGDVLYEYQVDPYHILVVDGEAPSEADFMETDDERGFGVVRAPLSNRCLVCVTAFLLGEQRWLRVQSRAWLSKARWGSGSKGMWTESTALLEGRTATICGLTDVGQQREANQDAFAVDEQAGWAVVADGMGGHPQGDVASADAVRAFREHMEKLPKADVRLPIRGVARHLLEAARKAEAAVWEHNKNERSIFDRMGTTLSALCLHGEKASIVHGGDSRIYRYRPGARYRETELKQITLDHGEGSGLDRALGLWERIAFDIDVLTVEEGTLFLLCSDGLSDMLGYDDMLRILNDSARQSLPPARLAQTLVDAANEAGGRDNITVCLVAVEDESEG